MNIFRIFTFLTIFGLFLFSTTVVHGEEDKLEPEAEVNDEETGREEVAPSTSDILEGNDEDPNRIPSSPDFRTVHVFTQPAKATELIAGKLTRLLVGARNKGAQHFVVESIDGSLRYPQDFSYYLQNFTTLRSDKLIEPGMESTFEYLFMPSETFNGRPLGLVVLINYRNNEGKRFQNVVFNQTVNLVDADEGFDAETFFLYMFLCAILVLVGFISYQYVVSPRVKRSAGRQAGQTLQGGQQGKGSFDPAWIPAHHLQSRSPRKSPASKKGRSVNGASTSAGAASSENDE